MNTVTGRYSETLDETGKPRRYKLEVFPDPVALRTINDPTVYSRPWTAVRPMTRLADYRIYEYACHEGNYALSGILAGARAEEKAAEEAAKKESGVP